MADEKVEELKARADLMGKCYMRGFGNCLAGISAAASNYVDFPNIRDESKNHALFFYSLIEAFYSRIVFEELEANKDFEPIFSARDLLSEYKSQLDLLFSDPTAEKRDRLYELNRSIIKTVEPYRWNFWGLTKEIRKILGNENFYVKVVDYQGVEWRF
jgi:hypothetical protein